MHAFAGGSPAGWGLVPDFAPSHTHMGGNNISESRQQRHVHHMNVCSFIKFSTAKKRCACSQRQLNEEGTIHRQKEQNNEQSKSCWPHPDADRTARTNTNGVWGFYVQRGGRANNNVECNSSQKQENSVFLKKSFLRLGHVVVTGVHRCQVPNTAQAHTATTATGGKEYMASLCLALTAGPSRTPHPPSTETIANHAFENNLLLPGSQPPHHTSTAPRLTTSHRAFKCTDVAPLGAARNCCYKKASSTSPSKSRVLSRRPMPLPASSSSLCQPPHTLATLP